MFKNLIKIRFVFVFSFLVLKYSCWECTQNKGVRFYQFLWHVDTLRRNTRTRQQHHFLCANSYLDKSWEKGITQIQNFYCLTLWSMTSKGYCLLDPLKSKSYISYIVIYTCLMLHLQQQRNRWSKKVRALLKWL